PVARAGDVLRVTATNPLGASVWFSPCCSSYDVLLIDELGRAHPCGGCPLDCAPVHSEEVAPGQSVSVEVTVPEPVGCSPRPGKWSVVWGRSFSLTPRPEEPLYVYGHAELAVLPAGGGPDFRRGDCDGSGVLDITDPVTALEFLFLGRAAPACADACDGDDSGALDITDAVAVLTYLFLGGEPPPPPFPLAGADPTPDVLSCQ
ncbi:MAG: hypothetical protein ACRDHY_02390, partial [Anaerolineales bacterium]